MSEHTITAVATATPNSLPRGLDCAPTQERRNVTVPGLISDSNARSAGISGRVSANRFDAARSATTAIAYLSIFCQCTMLLSIVISTSNPASTAFLNNSPFSSPAHPINGTDSPDVPANRAAIASPDFHPEEDASRMRRVHASALLQAEG